MANSVCLSVSKITLTRATLPLHRHILFWCQDDPGIENLSFMWSLTIQN